MPLLLRMASITIWFWNDGLSRPTPIAQDMLTKQAVETEHLRSLVLGGSLGGSWGVLGAPWGSLGGPWGAWGLLGSHTLVTPEEVGGYNIILHQRETPNSFLGGGSILALIVWFDWFLSGLVSKRVQDEPKRVQNGSQERPQEDPRANAIFGTLHTCTQTGYILDVI